MTTLAAYQAELLAKLDAVNEQLEALRAKEYLLVHERARLLYQLRNSGWRPPARAGE